ncbi:MAG TPA: NAD(P)-binding domain-containing protein [Candidatus Dormibacteraeota bacterium]|nr:NAD(P)-binding domain-containing protein [Candidatus Dormibacteraeota bacterium]
MAELTDSPFPPGRYPVVVVGSGPGALQLSYSLRANGVGHAVISADEAPGGMFRRWPIFQRMLSWTKPYAGPEPGTDEYERYDWNSLLGDERETRAIMPAVMDGTSYFPSRPEMERGLVTFAERAGISVRYRCTWESTRQEDRELVLVTSDGEYRAPVAVFAVGVAEPWRPGVLRVDGVQQYGELRPAEGYKDRRIFIIGKQNSGFEIATGLLPWARQIVLASPSPTKLSVETRSLVGVRARYVQPYEDWALAGGVVILDSSIEAVERTGETFVVKTKSADGTAMDFEADDVIAATGFTCPLRDLPQLGVATFGQSRLPAQTPFWESATIPGIFFAGTINQGSRGMLKHGIPSNSGAVQGYRYNARVLARHIAETRFGRRVEGRRLRAEEAAPLLLREATHGPELWHQRSYLARVLTLMSDGMEDRGIQPLAAFVDDSRPDVADGVAIALEANGRDDPYPAVYLRVRGKVSEHLLPPQPLLDFEGAEYQREAASLVKEMSEHAMSRSAQ